MKMINRGAVIVRPAPAYVHWAANLDDNGMVPKSTDECTVYLIRSFADDFEAWSHLSKVYAWIFENELFSWHTIKEDWPKNHNLTMFKEWLLRQFIVAQSNVLI